MLASSVASSTLLLGNKDIQLSVIHFHPTCGFSCAPPPGMPGMPCCCPTNATNSKVAAFNKEANESHVCGRRDATAHSSSAH